MNFIAQLAPEAPWQFPARSSALFTYILIGLVAGLVAMYALTKTPSQLRGRVVAFVTFIAGSFYVLDYAWPKSINRQQDDIPANLVDRGSFLLTDAMPTVVQFSQVIAGFLIGLGIYSLLRVHVTRIIKGHPEAFFSIVLLGSMALMTVVGLWDDKMRQGPEAAKLDVQENWTKVQYAKDFLFESMLQQMEATMFSLIAFYILSAAYRAFRVRSIEATILLGTALIVMLSILGLSASLLNAPFENQGFAENFKITEIAGWIRYTFQTPSINGIKIGVGIGAVAMSLRIWLSLEKTGSN